MSGMKAKDREKLEANLRKALGKDTKKRDKSSKGFGGVRGGKGGASGRIPTRDINTAQGAEGFSADESVASIKDVEISRGAETTTAEIDGGKEAGGVARQDLEAVSKRSEGVDDGVDFSLGDRGNNIVANCGGVSGTGERDEDALPRARSVVDGNNGREDEEFQRLRSLFGSSVSIVKPQRGAPTSPGGEFDIGDSSPTTAEQETAENSESVEEKPSEGEPAGDIPDGPMFAEGGAVGEEGGRGGATEEDDFARLRLFGRGVYLPVEEYLGGTGGVSANREKEEEERLRGFGRSSVTVVSLVHDCHSKEQNE